MQHKGSEAGLHASWAVCSTCRMGTGAVSQFSDPWAELHGSPGWMEPVGHLSDTPDLTQHPRATFSKGRAVL